MPINAPTPTNVPAKPAVSYDKYWVKDFTISSHNPAGKVRLMATLHKARDPGNGVMELSPVDPDVIVMIDDFAAAAISNPALATVRDDLLTQISSIAIQQGKI